MKHWLLLPLFLLLFGLAGCLNLEVVRGSGNVIEEERAVESFDEIALADTGRVHLTLGDKESLRIEAEDNLLPYLVTTTRNGRLTLGTEEEVILRPTESIDYYVTVRSLEAISVSGSGVVDAPVLRNDRFRVDISGSGGVSLAGLEADNLEVQISGSGDFNVAQGRVERQNVQISGSGNYAAEDLVSNQADIHTSGSGQASLNVQESLAATVSGSGNINYRGTPAVDQRVSGSGRIRSVGR